MAVLVINGDEAVTDILKLLNEHELYLEQERKMLDIAQGRKCAYVFIADTEEVYALVTNHMGFEDDKDNGMTMYLVGDPNNNRGVIAKLESSVMSGLQPMYIYDSNAVN